MNNNNLYVEGFDIPPNNFDFSFKSTYYKEFINIKNIFIDSFFPIEDDTSFLDIQNKLVSKSFYNFKNVHINYFLKYTLTNDMHMNIVINSIYLLALNKDNFISIADIKDMLIKIYKRYYYVYKMNLFPFGYVKLYDSMAARINNFDNRMSLVVQNIYKNTIMDI
jgi:hypothetical protein